MARKKGPQVQQAYDYIKDKIINFELAPGMPVSDHALEQELDMSRSPIREAMLLLTANGLVTGLLAFVNYLTADTIAEHTAEAARSAMTQVLAADNYTELPVSDAQAATGVTAAWSAGDAGTVVRLTTNGFGGAIDLMVGVDNENKVTGVAIISHSETASLGANCTREDFRAQFAGKTGELAVSKDGGDIDALTGATVTSRAVTRAVNAALAYAGEVQK